MMMKNLANNISSKTDKMKFKKFKSSINIRFWLLGLLLIGTATATSSFFSWGMAGLTGFFLAYVSKGMRRYRPPQ